MASASDHIVALRERKENLESVADEARAVLAERRQSPLSEWTPWLAHRRIHYRGLDSIIDAWPFSGDRGIRRKVRD